MSRIARPMLLASIFGASAMLAQTSSSAKPSTALLFKNIWRVTRAEPQPFHGTIYIFLPNGTLLETSCGEPYRVALWSRDPKDSLTLRITEDQRMVATWKIEELTPTTLRLVKKLIRSEETQEVTLTAVQQEFVCPDLPK